MEALVGINKLWPNVSTAEHFQTPTTAQRPLHIFSNTENLACLLKTQFFTEKIVLFH